MNRYVIIGSLVASCGAFACAASVPRGGSAPVESDDPILQDFQLRADRYMALHQQLSGNLPPQQESAAGGANRESSQALAVQIRAARSDARQGDVFTPDVARRLRERLNPVLRGASSADARSAIRDDAPPKFALRVNDPYPAGAPLPTVPGNVLAVLPVLPTGLEYRIVDRHLILHDVRANIIVDYLFDVMCATC